MTHVEGEGFLQAIFHGQLRGILTSSAIFLLVDTFPRA